MSIDGINGPSNTWQWRQAAAASGPGTVGTPAQAGGTATATAAGSAAGGITSFMQALSDDLQAMLTQLGSTASDSTGSASTQVAANRAVAGAHHHHHHQSGTGSDPALQSAANQVPGT